MRLFPCFAALLLSLFALATPGAADPKFWKNEWPRTNFDVTTIDNWVEILSGGPPKDGIPAVDGPEFLSAVDEAAIKGMEPVVTLELAGERARAYPIRYLTWHEIVNDTVGGWPVTVTFCPLCNSAMAFDGRSAHGTLTFGVSGKLRNSDMVMYDRQTESWWQQATAQSIVGDLTGTQLTQLPTVMESWDQYRARHPDGLVMAQPSTARPYGQNPYRGYDSAHRPFLYSGENPPHDIQPLVRVVRVGTRAWPVSRLRKAGGITEAGLSLSWEAGQASALDRAVIADSKDVGTVRVRDADGRDVAHDVLFAFAFHAFWPDGIWMLDQ
ncbi:MAG: DUF3179 domain-containing protein [Roseovarius sp.]